MRNSDRFLTALIIRCVISLVQWIVNQAKQKSPLVRKYEDDLHSYADLRNAIVHNRTSTEYIIAEPHTDVVERIEQIDQVLAKP